MEPGNYHRVSMHMFITLGIAFRSPCEVCTEGAFPGVTVEQQAKGDGAILMKPVSWLVDRCVP